VNQINRGSPLISLRDEREQLAEFKLIAGKRAKASTAYVSANTLLQGINSRSKNTSTIWPWADASFTWSGFLGVFCRNWGFGPRFFREGWVSNFAVDGCFGLGLREFAASQ